MSITKKLLLIVTLLCAPVAFGQYPTNFEQLCPSPTAPATSIQPNNNDVGTDSRNGKLLANTCFDNNGNMVISPNVLGGSGGVGSGAAPIIGWYLGPNCPVANASQCYFSPANTVIEQGCTWTATSTNVLCPAANFTATASAGQTVWGGTAIISCVAFDPLPQNNTQEMTATHLTVAGVVNATNLTLSANPTNASAAGQGCLIHGTPDDSFATAFEAAYDGAVSCPKIFLSGANYMFTTPHFSSYPTSCLNLPFLFSTTPNGFGNVFYASGIEFDGRGVGPTIIWIPPDFPETGNCTTVPSWTGGVAGCFQLPPGGRMQDLAFVHGVNALAGMPAGATFFQMYMGSLEHVTFSSIAGGDSSGSICLRANLWAQLQQVNITGCASIGYYSSGIPSSANAIYQRGYRVAIENNLVANLELAPTATLYCSSCQTEGSQTSGFGMTGQVVNLGGALHLDDFQFNQQGGSFSRVGYLAEGAGSILFLTNPIFSGFTGGTGNSSSIICTATCVNHLRGTALQTANSGHTYIDVAGSTLFDECGNAMGAAASASIAGIAAGDCSITGTADASGNHALTSGWGTANVNTVAGYTKDVRFTISITGGAPAASPVLTDTFATNFIAAPQGGCTLTQTGGTFGVLSNPVPSALTANGIAWTFTGTPVNGQSYTFARHCGN
jgi:hypothetical protein